jgi:hypothetical protein
MKPPASLAHGASCRDTCPNSSVPGGGSSAPPAATRLPQDKGLGRYHSKLDHDHPLGLGHLGAGVHRLVKPCGQAPVGSLVLFVEQHRGGEVGKGERLAQFIGGK